MLESLIKSVLDRDGKESGESTVVALHCAQMREWGVRGGHIEHRPLQDPTGERFKFLLKLQKHNHIQQRLDHIMDAFVCRGEILWYFQPDPENPGLYRIEFFVGGLNHPDPQFRVYYKPGGREFQRIIIRYSYDSEVPGTTQKQQRWVRITITQDWIEQSESLNKPEFDWHAYGGSFAGYAPMGESQFVWMNPTSKYENPFAPYFPVALSKNNARQLGQQGSDDFYWIRNLIEMHEGLVIKAHKNLRMFANPILITTRSAQEVMNQTSGANTWASANRYYDLSGTPYSGSTNTADVPSWGMQRTPAGMGSTTSSEGSLDTIFGNVGESERFAFIQANAVSSDQNLWIRQERELIHWILGGVDPIAGITSGTTFGEYKTVFGRVQNTAEKKSEALFGDTGLGLVYERILWREEEKLFKPWLFETLITLYPQAFAGLTSPEQLSDELCQRIWELRSEGQIELPENPVGMLPAGDRTVVWRYTREVFQNTTREELDRSIAARNEREDGLSQEWVLRKQYPNMTDQEIRNAMSGFSPRVVQNAALGIQSTLQLFQQFMALPDPQDPKVPWGIRLGLPQLLEQSLLTLQKEMAYGRPVYEPAEEIKPLSLVDIVSQFGGSPQVLNSTVNPDELSLPLSGDIATRDAPILQSMGLPTDATSAISGRLYRSGNTNSQLRGRTATEGTATSSAGIGSNSIFGQQLPTPGYPSNWGAGTPLGTVGDIDPQLLALYADQLRAILASLQQSGG
ncbi:hypothetical protein PCC6912_39660 [Chlorogloeopsis fritschii PCC 6912]|uniref:Uncharacterized protein n=1 Tax=Chlorogloeopsis fritschii PCC 6912 TaxID=211165 RepID=A0A433N699_CHLFR|nr:hypothetical protein [Chlorogloeopsis fritschii]RUR77007.1 hypothetical protein PCC6912_39660 [Chlorogloeopsis fritschii PCC 6912]